MTNKGALKMHMRMHQSRGSYKCSFCSNSYVVEHNLRKHMKARHIGVDCGGPAGINKQTEQQSSHNPHTASMDLQDMAQGQLMIKTETECYKMEAVPLQCSSGGTVMDNTASHGSLGGTVMDNTASQCSPGGNVMDSTASQCSPGGTVMDSPAPQDSPGGTMMDSAASQILPSDIVMYTTASQSSPGGTVIDSTASQGSPGGTVMYTTAPQCSPCGTVMDSTLSQSSPGGTVMGVIPSKDSLGGTVIDIPSKGSLGGTVMNIIPSKGSPGGETIGTRGNATQCVKAYHCKVCNEIFTQAKQLAFHLSDHSKKEQIVQTVLETKTFMADT